MVPRPIAVPALPPRRTRLRAGRDRTHPFGMIKIFIQDEYGLTASLDRPLGAGLTGSAQAMMLRWYSPLITRCRRR